MDNIGDNQVCYHETVLSSPLEVALRMLILLSRLTISADIQRLVIYDYLLLHSHDIENGPASLHPATPMRTGELLVRRNQISRGLYLLEARGLVEREYSNQGIAFRTSRLASHFLNYLESQYASRCRIISAWVADNFDVMSSTELQSFIDKWIGKWGLEFSDEPEDE